MKEGLWKYHGLEILNISWVSSWLGCDVIAGRYLFVSTMSKLDFPSFEFAEVTLGLAFWYVHLATVTYLPNTYSKDCPCLQFPIGLLPVWNDFSSELTEPEIATFLITQDITALIAWLSWHANFLAPYQ